MKLAPWIAVHALVLSACSTDVGGRPDHGPGRRAENELAELRNLLDTNEFSLLTPPRGDREPGTILDRGGAGEVVVGKIGSTPSLGPALFMSDWSAPAVPVSDASLFATIGKAGISSEMKRLGVAKYSWSFGECMIASVTLDELQQGIPALSEFARKQLERGCPVVVEALQVRSVDIAFIGGDGTNVSVGTEGLLEGLSIGASVKTTGPGSHSLRSEKPLFLGIRVRDFRLDQGARGLVELATNQDSEPNGSQGQASKLEVPTSVNGQVSTVNDERDWFELTAPGDGELTIHMTNLARQGTSNASVGPVRVYGPGMRHQLFSEVKPGKSSRNEHRYPVVAGATYFIEVNPKKGHTARYSLDLRFEAR